MYFEFIAMKDPHLSFGFQNRIRKQYVSHISNKLKFVKDYCKENEIKIAIFTGDVFDSSTEDKWSFKKYRKNKRVLEQLTTDGLKLYSNVGNHDMFHGLEDSDNTVFGEMVHDNILNNLTDHPLIIQEDDKILKIQGIDYSNEKNIVLDKLRIFDEEDSNMFKIAVLHSNVTPYEVKHVTDFTYDSLSKDFPSIDVFILGHYHLGYDTQIITRENGKNAVFINNWNFTRVVRDYETQLDEHSPEFEHCSLSYDKIHKIFKFETKTIKVPFVTYDQAFLRREINILQKSKQDIFNFFDSINIEDIKESSKKDDITLINEISKKNGYSDLAIAKSLEYLNN